jgi:hypothetical protein
MGEIGRPVSSRPVLANGYEQRCDRREHSLAQFVLFRISNFGVVSRQLFCRFVD